MRYITNAELSNLSNISSETYSLVSAYIPMHRYDYEINQTRFKNVLKSLRSRIPNLESYSQIGELMKLSDDPVFWAKQREGFCFFLAPDGLFTLSLPFAPPSFHEVSDRYYLAPLLLFRHAEEPFYVVAVSLKKVRLFDATLFEISERDVPGLDQDLFERLRIDEINETLQIHTTGREGRAGIGTQQVVHHGQGSGSEKIKTTLVNKFVRSVCQEAKSHLEDHNRKVIFAGAGSYFSLFKEMAGFPNKIVPRSIEGSFDTANLADMHDKISTLIRELMAESVKEADAMAESKRGTTMFEIREPKIIEAARIGRVDSLIVNVDRFLRDFRSESSEFRMYEAAIREAWLHGGKIIPSFVNYMLPIKATMRFPMGAPSVKGETVASDRISRRA